MKHQNNLNIVERLKLLRKLNVEKQTISTGVNKSRLQPKEINLHELKKIIRISFRIKRKSERNKNDVRR